MLRRQCQISTHYAPSFGLLSPLANVGLLYRVAYNQVGAFIVMVVCHIGCYRVGNHCGEEHGIIQCMQLLNCLVMLPLLTSLRDITDLEGIESLRQIVCMLSITHPFIVAGRGLA